MGGRQRDERTEHSREMCTVRCNVVTGDAQSPQSALPSAFTATLNFFRRLLIYRRLSSGAKQTGKLFVAFSFAPHVLLLARSAQHSCASSAAAAAAAPRRIETCTSKYRLQRFDTRAFFHWYSIDPLVQENTYMNNKILIFIDRVSG